MKRLFLATIVAAMCSMNACADHDQVITFAQLPAAAQQLVNDNFNQANISYVMLDKELFGDEYKVRFQDGSEIEFENDGSLKKVDCKLQAVPDALVPEEIRRHVSTQFPGAIIVEWGKDDRGWKAELNNKLELKYNSRLEFIGIDD